MFPLCYQSFNLGTESDKVLKARKTEENQRKNKI